MKNSEIGWTKHTFNPWEGCTKVSPGCSNCYAKGPEDRREAWHKALERAETTGSPVTARMVTEVVEAIRADADSPPPILHPDPSDEKVTASTSEPETALDVLKRLRMARQAQDWVIVDEVIEHLEAG